MGAPDQRWDHQEDRAEEGHAALPDRDNINRIFQIVIDEIILLDDEIESPAKHASADTPPENTIDGVLIDALASHISANSPQTDDDSNHIHKPIPAHSQRPNREDD